jgi:hypothetical protein
MLNTVVVGWIVVVLGIIAVMAGIAGAIIQLIRNLKTRKGGAALDVPTDIITAIRLLIEALVSAPVWLVLLIFGFALIVYGGTLIK